MDEPPTLDYDTPSNPQRWAMPCVFFLNSLGAVYGIFLIQFIVTVVKTAAIDFTVLPFNSVGAISALLFFIAASKIRSLRWAWIAFITALANLAALVSCLGWTYFAQGITDPSDIILGCVLLVPIAALISLSLLLGAHIGELKRRPT